MSFTDQTPQIATERDCKLGWGARHDGENFRCSLCGHRFKPGDQWRFVFTNDLPGAGGNPLVCAACDGTNEEVRAKWQAMHAEWKAIKARFWKFVEWHANETEQEYENTRGRRT